MCVCRHVLRVSNVKQEADGVVRVRGDDASLSVGSKFNVDADTEYKEIARADKESLTEMVVKQDWMWREPCFFGFVEGKSV